MRLYKDGGILSLGSLHKNHLPQMGMIYLAISHLVAIRPAHYLLIFLRLLFFHFQLFSWR
jgi:hypothetical protein